MAVHIYGVRHHGVGSARQILRSLELLKPDILLVEGPPEISDVLALVGKEGLTPPVAVMVYNSEEPKESSFYPFAEYSPEWIAVKYANKNKIPVRAMDLPSSISFYQRRPKEEEDKVAEVTIEKEPLAYLAEAAGFRNSEEWWENHFESGASDEQHFNAVHHAMDALREDGIESFFDRENVDREAYMRTIIRQAQNEMYERIAVVCGAWHAPALVDLDGTAKGDAKILKQLPKTKIRIAATWIPWTNSRLSMFSGYGAGIYSPGWYEHQWNTRDDIEIKWLTKVAGTFRQKGIDVSTAHVIETYRLARSLAIIRNKSFVSLDELNEAILSVMCMGDAILLTLIREKLIVGANMGTVPDDIPKVPLQEDFEQHIKSLRLKLSAAPKQHDLDLRKDIDLERSIFFHRLVIIDIPWTKRTESRSRGTFKESWTSEWTPEMMIALVDKAFLGNTVESAAQNIVTQKGQASNKITELTELIQLCIPAQLYDNLDRLLERVNELSSLSADIIDLMSAIPGLVEVTRYGDVRKSDLTVLNTVVQQLMTKVFIGLSNACYGLDEDNSRSMFELISRVNHAVRLYDSTETTDPWYESLRKLNEKQGINHLITGCVCRLLLDAQKLTDEETEQKFSLALSAGNDPFDVALWLEGFLGTNGTILLYDNRLWNLLYTWLESLPEESFQHILAMLRRAFSKFEFGERRQIGERAKKGKIEATEATTHDRDNFNVERAVSILPIVKELLGK
jgi:hypothetical protein